ncbi:MAG TPA: VWA domain-containing protein [Myxococcota bacterium]|nr:VWA domain-containing protein [Myxococcota bacterium]
MKRALTLLAALAGLACSEATEYRQAVAVLVDVSGTYTDQATEVARILKREVLPSLVPGDALLLVRIDSQSYERENLEALVTLDARPSKANAEKLALAKQIDAIAAGTVESEYTDIRGALMLAAEYLREIPAGSRVILVFSDMNEDLPNGTTRELEAKEFADIDVVAVNVKRLQADNADPQLFRGRLASWQERVLSHGAAGWREVLDAGQLPVHLAQLR